MTNKEAIDKLKDRYLGMSCYATIEECKADNTALDIAIEALEKQIPKKPIKIEKDWGHIMFIDACPICKITAPYSDFCPNCGQAIDWSDDNGI